VQKVDATLEISVDRGVVCDQSAAEFGEVGVALIEEDVESGFDDWHGGSCLLVVTE
jgi:hypothetical protein